MPNHNSVTLVGHLTRDPELKQTQGGKSFATCGIAVSEKWKDRDGNQQQETMFIDFVVWGGGSSALYNYCKKGDPLLIVGKLKLEQWEDRNGGGKRSKHTVNVNDFQFLKGRKDGGPAGDAQREFGQPSDYHEGPDNPPF